MIFLHLTELQSGELSAQGISDLNTCEKCGSVDQDLTFTVSDSAIFNILQLPLLLLQSELVLHITIPMKSDKI